LTYLSVFFLYKFTLRRSFYWPSSY